MYPIIKWVTTVQESLLLQNRRMNCLWIKFLLKVTRSHTSLSPHSLTLQHIAFIITVWAPLIVLAQSNNSFNGLFLLHNINSKYHKVCSYKVGWTFCLLGFAWLVGKLYFIHLSFRLKKKSSYSYQFQTGTRKIFLMEYSGTLSRCIPNTVSHLDDVGQAACLVPFGLGAKMCVYL